MKRIDSSLYIKEIYQIYQEAFPKIEQRTKEDQEKVFHHPLYRLRTVQEGAESIQAFLGYWELNSCLFLEHLAVKKEYRGNGLGGRLLKECIQEGKEAGKPIFLEIEPVTRENPITERREMFYRRYGFSANSFFYQQMPLKPGDMPIPLWIMSWPTPISEKDFLPYKKEIYKKVYQIPCLNTK